jgi:anti-sigma regulatory factor (Ser/Thr protein kinase)
VTLAGVPAAAHEARVLLRSWMTARACTGDAIETVELLLTEIIANAVRHTDSEKLQMTAAFDGRSVRVGVEDCSAEPPRQPPDVVDPERPGGRGVWLVERLSQAWGWDLVAGGKRVWFELACPPLAKARPAGHGW